MPKRLALWIGLSIAIVLGCIWQFYPLSDASQQVNSLPLFGKAFKGRNLPLNDSEKAYFKNVNVMKRVYEVGHQQLFIAILDGTNNRHLVHDPLYCFRGGGWEVVNQENMALPEGDAVFLLLQKDNRQQQAMYWFTDGKSHYASPLRYWWETMLRRFTLGHSGPEPVLITVQPLDKEKLNPQELFKHFPELFKI